MKILIIEDEFMIRKGIRHQLENMDLPDIHIESIWEAEDGIEADELLVSHTFDIVFTDINMPDMDGLTLLGKWEMSHPNTQWVIISGHDSFHFAQKAIIHGARDYLLKPVTRRKLTTTFERLVANYKERQLDFIEVNEMDEILDLLEGALWVLNEEMMIKTITDWANKIEKKQLHSSYYQHVLNHLLQTLVERIDQKGSINLDLTFDINGNTFKEITNAFITHCQTMIEAIRHQRKGKMIDPIEAAKEYMISKIGEKVNLDDVAERLGFNPSYFSQLFKRETGQTFVEYRINLRMEVAKKLLERNEMRIIDICSEIGYDDAPHFTKTFKKYTGFSPTEYRKSLGIDA
ncbi:helix-turn-helix domain-containing protein [Bacillus sp. AK128]